MAVVVAAAGALMMPTAAPGATAKVVPVIEHPELPPRWGLRYTAQRGERNRVSVRLDQSRNFAIVTDPGVRQIRTGYGCLPLAVSKVLCDATVTTLPKFMLGYGLVLPRFGFETASADLGDRDDTFRHLGTMVPRELVDGGPGDDVVRSGGSTARVHGGAGDDRLAGGSGSDTLHPGPGADDVSGGTASSTTLDTAYYDISYEPNAPRSVSLDDVADDGVPGEGDNVHSDVEGIFVEGDTADTLIGNAGPNWLTAGGGNDRLLGLGGSDSLQGGFGDDELEGGTGSDTFGGSVGDDLLLARDGEADREFNCSAGFDRLVADLIDPAAFACEEEDRG